MISILLPSSNETKIFEMLNSLEAMFPGSQLIVCNDRERKGKGWAVRQALTQATGDIICFIDGDMDIHPKMILRLLPHLNEFDIVVGKKDLRGFLSRRIVTILSRLYIYLLFGIKVDTQTGVKVFKREALLDWHCDSYAFDIEILYKAKLAGYSMFQVTVDAEIVRKMKLKSIVKTFIESMRIKWPTKTKFTS